MSTRLSLVTKCIRDMWISTKWHVGGWHQKICNVNQLVCVFTACRNVKYFFRVSVETCRVDRGLSISDLSQWKFLFRCYGGTSYWIKTDVRFCINISCYSISYVDQALSPESL